MLLSWGGERIDKIKGVRNFEKAIMRFEGQIARMGVQHEDIRPPNMLWNLHELPANRKRKQSFGASKNEIRIRCGE